MRFGEIYSIRSDGGTYVGSSIGYSTRRWAEHLRLLRAGKHHCKKLQEAFNASGPQGLSFRIVVEDVPERNLQREEYEWTLALEGINTPPSKEVRAETQRIVCLDIAAGMPYREIAYKHRISLGTVAAIKAKFRVELQPKNARRS